MAEQPIEPLLYRTLTDSPSLYDADGQLFTDKAQLSQKAAYHEVVNEVKAQWQKVSQQVVVNHIDFHMHSLVPGMGFRGYKAFFEAYKAIPDRHIRRVRMASSYYNSPPLNYIWGGHKMGIYAFMKMKQLRLTAPNYCFAFPYSALSENTLDEKRTILSDFFREMREGVTEMYIHPCIETESLRKYNPSWKNRTDDYQLMLGINKVELWEKYGIKLMA